MNIVEEKTDGIVTVALNGRLDAASAKPVEDRLQQLIDGGEHRLVLDLAGLDYISSVGLRVFISTAKRLKTAGGRLVFCCLRATVTEVFEIAGFSMLFRMCPAREEAMAVLR
jgi:anti-anti-sigma factor